MGDILRFDCSESHVFLDYVGVLQCLMWRGNVEAQGERIASFVFYLLGFDCNHVTQKPEMWMYLFANL